MRTWNIIYNFCQRVVIHIFRRKKPSNCFSSYPFVSELEYDLLQASVALTDDNNLYIDDGLDGFPSFGFRPGSEVKQPYRLYLPEKLPAEFTLVATFKPTSFRTSYLFAVLNPFETVVQLGIRISVSTSIYTYKGYVRNP